MGSHHQRPCPSTPSCSRCQDGGHIEIRQKVHEAAQIEIVGILSAWILMDPHSQRRSCLSLATCLCSDLTKLTSLGMFSVNSHGTVDTNPCMLPSCKIISLCSLHRDHPGQVPPFSSCNLRLTNNHVKIQENCNCQQHLPTLFRCDTGWVATLLICRLCLAGLLLMAK